MRGLFIIIEGLDRTGKTTQSDLLQDRLKPSFPMSFPNELIESGKQLRDYLLQKNPLTDMEAHTLFAVNRKESADQIIENLEKGVNVICSRYAFSGVAYTSQKGYSIQESINADIGILIPDLTIVLVCDVAGIESRFDSSDRYESTEVQERVRSKYAEIMKLKNIGTAVTIDVTGKSIAEVQSFINTEVDKVLLECQTEPRYGLFEGNFE